MSRRRYRCRNVACPIAFGATLGFIAGSGELELAMDVVGFAVHLDTRRATIRCPACGSIREYRGSSVFSGRPRAQATTNP